MNTDTCIAKLRVGVSAEAALRTKLRLTTQLAGADLHPPGLAPSAVLLVRRLTDPAPGQLRLDDPVPVVDRRWERAARDVLTDCLHRAARPKNGRVYSGAEAILFQDESEAWACWCREQSDPGVLRAGSWWVRSLESSIDERIHWNEESSRVAAMWRAQPRLVPAITAYLARWGVAGQVLQQLSETEAERILRTVCSVFETPIPPVLSSDDRRVEEKGRTGSAWTNPPGTATESASARSERPSSEHVLAQMLDARSVAIISEQPPVYQQLFGVALALWRSPITVRSPAFQKFWKVWRQALERGSCDLSNSELTPTSHLPGGGHNRVARTDDGSSASVPELPEERPFRQAMEPGFGGESPSITGEREDLPDLPTGEHESPPRGAYAATDLGGVFYLINVLDALGLPDSATAPPVGEYVGAWAILEVLARALLGPELDTRHAHDPLWRVLADLDGRPPTDPAGRGLEEAFPPSSERLKAFRLPPRWLNALLTDASRDGYWAVAKGRLSVWTDHACIADLAVAGDPKVQAETEWRRLPGAGLLKPAGPRDQMPSAVVPTACAPALGRWAALAAPYIRHRVAAALGIDDRASDWTAGLFSAPGRLYTTAAHVDLILPLGAAHIDVRVAGLDKSPGWWSSGGRVVRFHFRAKDVNT